MKKIYLLIILFFQLSFAQNDALFTHYFFMPQAFNPASCATNHLEAKGVVRMQWLGMNQGPRTQAFTINSSVDALKGGLGLYIINDKLGYENIVQARLNYAYKHKLGYGKYISIGAGIGVFNKNLNISELVFYDQTEPFAVNYPNKVTTYSLSAGIQAELDELTIGLAGSYIDKNVAQSTFYKIPRHLYGYAKYNLYVSPDITIEPNIGVRTTLFSFQPEVNINAYFKDKFWIGAAFRNQDAISGLIGLIIKNKYKIGYSYDYNYSNVNMVSNGSHEFYLMGDLGDINPVKKAYKSPRFLQ